MPPGPAGAKRAEKTTRRDDGEEGSPKAGQRAIPYQDAGRQNSAQPLGGWYRARPTRYAGVAAGAISRSAAAACVAVSRPSLLAWASKKSLAKRFRPWAISESSEVELKQSRGRSPALVPGRFVAFAISARAHEALVEAPDVGRRPSADPGFQEECALGGAIGQGAKGRMRILHGGKRRHLGLAQDQAQLGRVSQEAVDEGVHFDAELAHVPKSKSAELGAEVVAQPRQGVEADGFDSQAYVGGSVGVLDEDADVDGVVRQLVAEGHLDREFGVCEVDLARQVPARRHRQRPVRHEALLLEDLGDLRKKLLVLVDRVVGGYDAQAGPGFAFHDRLVFRERVALDAGRHRVHKGDVLDSLLERGGVGEFVVGVRGLDGC